MGPVHPSVVGGRRDRIRGVVRIGMGSVHPSVVGGRRDRIRGVVRPRGNGAARKVRRYGYTDAQGKEKRHRKGRKKKPPGMNVPGSRFHLPPIAPEPKGPGGVTA
jgi:hypothetical protein